MSTTSTRLADAGDGAAPAPAADAPRSEQRSAEQAAHAAQGGELSIVSLFSGAGGFDEGFKISGSFVSQFAVELKEAPAATLRANLFGGERRPLGTVPASPSADELPMVVQGNVEELSFHGLKGLQPDVLIGGPPCQDFSVMNGQNRRGTEVRQGNLYLHFVTAVAALRPRAFVFENVPGLISANDKKAFETIKADLKAPLQRLRKASSSLRRRDDVTLGDLSWVLNEVPCSYELLFEEVVDAPYLGVPQTRRRLIVIGLREDVADDLGRYEVERARKHLGYKMKGRGFLFRKYPLTCLEAFEGRPLVELQDRYEDVMEAYGDLAGDPEFTSGAAKKWVRRYQKELTHDVVQDYLLANGHGLSLFREDEFERAMEEHVDVLKTLGYYGRPVYDLEPEDGSNVVSDVSPAVEDRMWRTPPGCNYKFVDGTEYSVEGKGLSLIYRRPEPLAPAPTVVAFGGGGTYAYHYDRERNMLTNRERARLQTFPDSFLFQGNVTEMRQQIGEAVPPLLAMRIADELKKVLSA